MMIGIGMPSEIAVRVLEAVEPGTPLHDVEREQRRLTETGEKNPVASVVNSDGTSA